MDIICQYCGQKSSYPMTSSCQYSPTKHHVVIAQHALPYVCQYCSVESRSPESAGSCINSPTKHHVYI
jgi:hypothetical protein